jgi:hypothetical protein
MTTYRVTFEVEIPEPATYAQADEFIRFYLGARGDMAADNPLADIDLMSCDVRGVSVD